MRNKHKEQCIKKCTSLSDYIYSIATLQCKACLVSTEAGQFTKSYKIMEKYKNLFLFSLQAT